jgi:drug/metabolite transporter (DMT)-like permease
VADYGLLTLLSAIFGAAFVLNGLAVDTVPPLTAVCVRLGLAALLLFVVAKIAGKELPAMRGDGAGRVWFFIFASAILGNALPFFLITWGQQRVDAGLAAILTSISPLLTLLLAHWFTQDEKLDRYKLIGVLFGFIGIVNLFGFDKLLSLGDEALSQYAMVGAALCYAVNSLVMKKLTGLPRYGTVASVLFIAFVIMIPFSLILDGPVALLNSGAVSWISILAIFLLAVFASAGGNLLRFKIVERQGASFLSQLNYIVPFFALFWAFVVLAEIPPVAAYVSLAMILIGLAIARLSSPNKQRGNVI